MSKFKTASTMTKEWEEASKRIQTEAEIRAGAIKDFAEWLTHNFVYTHGIGFSRLSFSRKYTVDEVIAEYEKEQE